MRSPEHPVDELPGLLAGEVDLATIRPVIRHVRSCGDCQAALVEMVGAAAALRHVAPVAGDTAAPAPHGPRPPRHDGGAAGAAAPPVAAARRSRRRVLAGVGAAAAVSAAALLGILLPGRQAPSRSVPLLALGRPAAAGTVRMAASGAHRTMTVSTTLPLPPSGGFYEVWLLDTVTGDMVPVGLLSGGRGVFVVPDAVAARYDAIDISLQANDGNPAHSADSVLRARFPAA